MSRIAVLRPALRGFAEQWVLNMPASRRLRFFHALNALEQYAQGRVITVLDAGCGEGLFTEMVARRHRRWTIVGADLDEAQLEKGRRRVEEAKLGNVHFEHLDLTRDLGRSEYDAVVAIECLMEIEDDESALHSMARALRSGGLFFAHVPKRDWAPVLSRSEATWRHEVRHGYTVDDLTSMLSRAGLTETSVRPSSRAIVQVAQEIRDRIKTRGLKLQLAALPLSMAAVRLERWGLSWGDARAIFVEARRR